MAKQVVAPLPSDPARRSDVPDAVVRVLVEGTGQGAGRNGSPRRADLTAALEDSAGSIGGTTQPPAQACGGVGGPGRVAATVLLFALGSADRRDKPPETPRIAVLPFQNLGSPDDGYFSDGITEEITSRLAMIPTLGVISRTSAEQYRGSGKSMKDIGHELGVDYILEGSVRWEKSNGSQPGRVTPQLIRVSDDRHLWSGRFDETLEEVFQVQSRIAEEVATELDLALKRPEHEALSAKPTEDLRAYDFYLRGNDYFDRPGDPDAYRTAEEMYATGNPARSRLRARVRAAGAVAYLPVPLLRAHRGPPGDGARRRGLRVTPAARPAEGHLALGQIHYWGELDYEAALREFRTAHEADPGNGDIWPGLGVWSNGGWESGTMRSPICGAQPSSTRDRW